MGTFDDDHGERSAERSVSTNAGYFHELWRAKWVVIGLLATIVTAASDQIHRSFLPSRTERWQACESPGLH